MFLPPAQEARQGQRVKWQRMGLSKVGEAWLDFLSAFISHYPREDVIGYNSNFCLAGSIASNLSITGTGGVRVKAKITHEQRVEGAMLAFTSKSGYPTHAFVSHMTSSKDDGNNGKRFSVRIPILLSGTDRLDVLVVNITATAAATIDLDKMAVPSSHVVMIRLTPPTTNEPLLFQAPLEDALFLNKYKIVVMRAGKSVELCSYDQSR